MNSRGVGTTRRSTASPQLLREGNSPPIGQGYNQTVSAAEKSHNPAAQCTTGTSEKLQRKASETGEAIPDNLTTDSHRESVENRGQDGNPSTVRAEPAAGNPR
eukprot:Filipodium_phascolosomae@DN1605_c0_g1_i1.p1